MYFYYIPVHTPLYKILFFLGGSLLLFFASITYLLVHESDKMTAARKELENSSPAIFAQLTEYHTIRKFSGTYHSYTYKVPDFDGELHEVTEVVDNELNRKLRVGDTVPVKRKTVELFGKTTIISMINGNKLSYKPLGLLIQIGETGTVFFIVIVLIGFFNWLKVSLPYSQKDPHP